MKNPESFTIDLKDLIDYTDWERKKWHDWMRGQGDQVLQTSVGPHGDNRFQIIGDYVRHIFSAETRYVDRLSGRPMTDTATVPNDNIEALFEFGRQSRREFRRFVETLPVDEWDRAQEFKLVTSLITVTPRKVVVHMVLHETRHWAQIATLFRLNGLKGDFHDFLFSPVFGGELKLSKGI